MYKLIDEVEGVIYETTTLEKLLGIIERVQDKYSNYYTGKSYTTLLKLNDCEYKIKRSN